MLKGYMLICRNAEGYMVRERLGTAGLDLNQELIPQWLALSLML